MDENVNQGNVDPNDDNVIGILSYLFWPVAYILFMNKKSEYNTFHVRQGLGILIIFIAVMIVVNIFAFIPFLGWIFWILSWFIYIFISILAIIGLIGAINKEMKEVPIIGKPIAELLKNLK